MHQIFQIRSKNLPVKANFSKQYSDEDCVVKECQDKDSQKELFHCIYLESKNIVSLNSHEYGDVNDRNVELQSRVAQIIFENFKAGKSTSLQIETRRQHVIRDNSTVLDLEFDE